MENKLYKKYIRNFDIDLLDCPLLGQGRNGIVYLLPDKKAIKICFSPAKCLKEYTILKKAGKSRYFPATYGMSGNYMIRDYVEGVNFKDYVKAHGLGRETAMKLIGLLEEFKRIGFKKQDIRCKDILVQPDGSLMVIDPKKFLSKERDFPRHLAKGLYRLGMLDEFTAILKKERPKLYRKWNAKIEGYIKEKKLEYERRRQARKTGGSEGAPCEAKSGPGIEPPT